MSITTSISTSSSPLPLGVPEGTAHPTGDEFPAPSIVRLSVGQYLQMVENGILEESNQIEFLEGILVEKSTKKPATGFLPNW